MTDYDALKAAILVMTKQIVDDIRKTEHVFEPIAHGFDALRVVVYAFPLTSAVKLVHFSIHANVLMSSFDGSAIKYADPGLSDFIRRNILQAMQDHKDKMNVAGIRTP